MSHPVEIFGTQDLHDDDGKIIDDFFKETDSPPDLRMAVEPLAIPARVEPTPTTRLLTGYMTFPATGGVPFQALPADKNRKSLHLRTTSLAAVPALTDMVFVADELSKLSYLTGITTNAGPLMNGVTLSLDEHTGPLWIAPGPALTGQFTIVWLAVTI